MTKFHPVKQFLTTCKESNFSQIHLHSKANLRSNYFDYAGEPPQPSTDLLEHYFNVTLEGFEDAALLAIEEPEVDDSELEQQGIW